MAADEDEFRLPEPIQALLNKVNPTDAAILGGGAYIGWLEARPGFTFPSPADFLGVTALIDALGLREIPVLEKNIYIGLPDFLDLILHWRKEEEKSKTRVQGLINARQAFIDEFADEDCTMTRKEFFDSLGDIPSQDKGRMWLAHQRRCAEGVTEVAKQEFDQKIAEEQKLLRWIQTQLYKYKAGQAIGMGILAYAVTRPGFLQGIGQIATGIGELVPG